MAALEQENGEEPDDSLVMEDVLSGRCLDLDVMALQKVIDWAVGEKWLPRPELEWKKLAEQPALIRLLEPEELDAFANATLLTPEGLAAVPLNIRAKRQLQAVRSQLFSDYVHLIFFSGGRETETRMQKWSNVRW